MKKSTSTVFLLCSALLSHAQVPYTDLGTAGAIAMGSAALKTEQNKTNSNLTAIERGQMAVMGQLSFANSLQNKILKGLTEVSGTLTNAMYVQDIYKTSQSLSKNMAKAISIAAGNPELALFAEKQARHLKNRSLKLVLEVSRVLTSGEANMMDAGERQKLIYHVYKELRLLEGTAFNMCISMHYAKMNGVWNSLNPFRMWVNQDLQIMKDILRKMDGI